MTSTRQKVKFIIKVLMIQSAILVSNLFSQSSLDFVGSPTQGLVPLMVKFTATVNLTGTITSIYWSFGDGETSSSLNPTHTYTAVGIYTVYFKVYTTYGNGSVTKFNYISVSSMAALSTPLLISPSNNAIYQSQNVSLSWEKLSNASTYHLQVSTNLEFSTRVFDDSTVTVTSKQIGPLENNKTYCWRVNAKNAGGTSAWSNIWSFTTGGMYWTSQTSGTSKSLYSVHFTDTISGWAAGYNGIIIHTTNGGLNWISQTGSTSFDLWRVHFSDKNYGWAVGWYGTIIHTLNGGVSWTSQTSGRFDPLRSVYFTDVMSGWSVGYWGTIIHTTNGGVSWTSQTSGTSNDLYSIHFTDASNGWAVGDKATIIHTTNGGVIWQSQMITMSNYLLSVHCINAGNGWAVGEKGTIIHTTNGGISWQQQTSGTTNDLWSVRFIDTSNGWAVGQKGTIIHTTNGGTIWTLQTSGISNYLYSVYFINESNGWAVGENGIILKYNPLPVSPSTPTITSPSNSIIDVSTSPKLSWNASNGATSYRLQVSTSSTFSTMIVDQSGITGTSYSISGLLSNTLYYWRMNATNPGGISDWSSVWSFTTTSSTSIDITNEISTEFKLYQNYPNPFNPTTTFKYQLPKNSEVSLKIYNVLGQLVKTLVDEKQIAGYYTVRWDGKNENGKNIASGVYLYKLVVSGANPLRTSDFTKMKKMIILR